MSNAVLIENSVDPYAYTTTVDAVTPQKLGSDVESLTELMIQADPTNTEIVKIGSATVQCWSLEPGDYMNVPISNPGKLYGISTSGTQRINTFGRKGV